MTVDGKAGLSLADERRHHAQGAYGNGRSDHPTNQVLAKSRMTNHVVIRLHGSHLGLPGVGSSSPFV